MKKKVKSVDWKIRARLGVILGVVMLLGAVLTWMNAERVLLVEERMMWQNYTIVLGVVGIVLLIFGFICRERAKEEVKKET